MGLALEAEAWLWYAIALSTIVLRYVSRFLQLGSLREFQLEDYCMLFVSACYTVLTVFLVKVAVTPTNLIPPDEVSAIDASSIPARIYGSKLVIVVEQFWCATVWGCKACLLLLYSTLTIASRQRYLLYVVGIYVAVNYCIMIILFFAYVRIVSTSLVDLLFTASAFSAASLLNPDLFAHVSHKNSGQCSTYHDHLIVNTVFNISSDVMMLLIPLPIFIRLKLPLRKKIILCAIFSLGIFVILSAILSKYYSFRLPYGVDWVFWYVREVGTAVMVANIPHCWVLVRKIFNARSFLSNGTSTHRSQGGLDTLDRDGLKLSTHGRRNGTENRSQWYKMKGTSQLSGTDIDLSISESQERINQKPLEIYRGFQYRVDHDQPVQRKSSDLDSPNS